MGFIHKNFGKTLQNLAKMSSKEHANFMLDVVSNLEKGSASSRGLQALFFLFQEFFWVSSIQTSCILVLAENDHEASYEKERDPPKEENR
jgi:hypothetical protein